MNIDTLVLLNNDENTFLGISIDVYAVILIPVIIFLTGYFIQIWRENSKETNRINVLREYILIQYEELVKDLEKSVENFSEFIQEFNKTIFQNLTLRSMPFLHYKNIISVDQTDKYKVFISGKKCDETKKIKLFDGLEKKVYKIDQLHILLNEEFKYYMFKINTYNDQWGDNIQQIEQSFREFAQLNKSRGISPDEDPFLKEFDLILSNWSNAGSNRDIQYVMDYIIKPLHNLCNLYKTDQRREIIIDNIIQCMNAYDNMKNLRKFFEDMINGISTDFKEFVSEFQKEIKLYNLMKDKRIRL